MIYNWQQRDWPQFKYDLTEIEDILLSFAENVGWVRGLLNGLPEDVQNETLIDMMVAEAVKTSEIEGEYLNRIDVASSIKKYLGLVSKKEQVRDKRAEGVAELIIEVRNSYDRKLTKTKLFSWHQMVMKGSQGYKIGDWRTGENPMQVVTGVYGKEKVHFVAPPPEQVPGEMKSFIKWFDHTGRGGKKEIKNPVIRSAIAHLYFETIRPFEDGNGRIGRALSDKALLQGFEDPILLSLSKTIEQNKNEYYDALKEAQCSNEITSWIAYFSKMVLQAQTEAEEEIDFTLRKTKLFDRFETELNERQLKVIRRMLEEGPKGFTGDMSAKKYMSIAQTTKSTATRDLQNLVALKIFVPIGGGRSTSYKVNI
jgi:Fic family protein